MTVSEDIEGLERFKVEATCILEDAKFPLHKWESNVEELDGEDMPNPSKILGHGWDKQEDTLEVTVPEFPQSKPVTKKTVPSHLGSIYDPMGILSPNTFIERYAKRKPAGMKKCQQN